VDLAPVQPVPVTLYKHACRCGHFLLVGARFRAVLTLDFFKLIVTHR
jgi:hypothetical protein